MRIPKLNLRRERVRKVLHALAYPFDRFELDDFVNHVARYRGKPILTLTISLSPMLYGVWIPAQQRDYIFCNDSLQPIHQTHVILHELAHMLLGHRLHRLDEVLAPDLIEQFGGRELIGRMRVAPHDRLAEDQEEQESEQFVFMIQKHLVRARRLEELTKQSTSIESLRPIIDAMGYTD